MSISSMRWRAASVFITAGAMAAALLALAVPAGASTGTTEISPEQAGYTATGARFQSIDARVFLRQPAQYAGEVGRYGQSVQLWSSGYVVVAGVSASTSGSAYTPYAEVFDPSGHQVLASDPGAKWCDDHTFGCISKIGTFSADEGVFIDVYYDATRGFVHFEVADLYDELYMQASYKVGTGVSFTQARVGTEFGGSPWDGSYSYTPPAQRVKVASYTRVYLTSNSGHTATLWSWWVHHKLLANTGQQSGSDWVAIPDDLTAGGASFRTWFVPQSGQSPNQPTAP